MTRLMLDRKTLTLHLAGKTSALDLTRALRVRMWNRSEIRYFEVSDFDVGAVYPLADGLRIMLVNRSEGLFVPVVFRPTDDGFRVSVPAGEICETRGIDRKIMEIGVLPELMTSRVGQAGWFLLPCFSGTLADFRDRPPIVNRDRLYMEQSEWEKFNLPNAFASNVEGLGVLAIVHKGDFFCHVTTEMNQAGRNRIFPSFGLRHRDAEVVKHEDKEVIYRFASGRDAEWPRMAQIYRDYLIRERGVAPLKTRMADNPVLAYAVEAMRVKIFMGLKRPAVPDGSTPMTVYATFEQSEAILDRMKAAGIDRAVVTLVGWNLGGHDGAYPTRFPVEPALGGEAGLRQLIAKALAMGYQIVPHDNVTEGYRPAPDFDYEYVARHADGEPLVVGLWGGGQAYKICPAVYLDRYGQDFARVKDLGFSGSYYLDAQQTVLWRCHSPRHPVDEEQYAIGLARMTQIARTLYGAVSVEVGPAYALPFVDEPSMIATPGVVKWAAARCPGNLGPIFSRVVPFYAVAVHGLVCYQDGWIHAHRRDPGGVRQGWLRALSYGARPCMEVSWTGGANGDPYEASLRDVREAYAVNFDELRDVQAEPIVEYEELGAESSRLVYANGVGLAVNWGLQPAAGLAPLSYRLTR
jgi:hypothetical protein